GQIHGRQLPLAQRVRDPRLETASLLLVADLQPILEQHDAAIDHVLLDSWAELEKRLLLFLRAEAHDPLDARSVVPAAVEENDLPRPRKVGHVALHVHLALLARGRRGQGHDPKDARAHTLGDGADRAALPGPVAPFEDGDDAQALVLDPLLK